MRLALKIVFAVLATLAVLAGIVAVAADVLSERKFHRQIALDVAPVALTSDVAAIERGRYLYRSRGCAECHGQDGGGRAFIGRPGDSMYVKAPNITSANGVTRAYGERDWPRTIRHGVKPSLSAARPPESARPPGGAAQPLGGSVISRCS